MTFRIHTFTPEELADDSFGAVLRRPAKAVAGVPYILVDSPSAMGLTQVEGLSLVELRDALSALPVERPKTVEAWNTMRRAQIDAAKRDQRVTGLECPCCGPDVFLEDTHPGILLMSNPPQKRLDCPKCGHIAHILA